MAPSYTAFVSPSAGFHPTLTTEITELRPLGTSCSLHLLFDFGSSTILDQYQIRQLHSEGRLVYSKRTFDDAEQGGSAKNKGKGKPIQAELHLGGYLDLEAPISQVSGDQHAYALLSLPMAGSSSGVNLPPAFELPSVDVTVEMPLHLRYQEPVLSRYLARGSRGGHGGGWYIKKTLPEARQDSLQVEVPWPCVFWACADAQTEADGDEFPYRKMGDSSSCIGLLPHDLRASLPQNSPAHPNTTNAHHYMLPMQTSSEGQAAVGKSFVTVPTGVLGDLHLVTVLNLLATWVAFLLIGGKIINVARKMRKQEKTEQHQVEAVEQEKKST